MIFLFLLLFDPTEAGPVHCAQPEVPENGHVVFPSNGPLKPGTLISYKCDVGFVHLGPEQRRCRPDGRWSKAPPICAVNVGLYKPSRERRGGDEWRNSETATDGDLEVCSPTDAVHVTLLQRYAVYAVELLLKSTKASGEVKPELGIRISVYDGPASSAQPSLCYSHQGPLELNKLHTFVCTRSVSGGSVAVEVSGDGAAAALCEVFVLSTAAASAWQCGSLPGMESWGVQQGRCYHASREGLPWQSAKNQCGLSGATLVGPVTPLLGRYLKSQLLHRAADAANFYWLGLSGGGEAGDWRWWNGAGLEGGEGDWAGGLTPQTTGSSVYAAAMARGADWEWRGGLQALWHHWLCQSAPLFCASPGVPAQGGVMLSSQTYGIGTTAYYYCNYGFVLRGPESRTCQANGTWSERAPLCYAVNCGAPDTLDNGFVTLLNSSSAFGALASHNCEEGFALDGASERQCQADGSWSPSPPVCRSVDCGRPPGLRHGSVQLGPANATGLGAVARHRCRPSYRLHGPALRHCLPSGRWGPDAPACLPDSGPGPALRPPQGPPASPNQGPQRQDPLIVNMGGISQLSTPPPPSAPADDRSHWRHQTNLMTGFIVAVVVLLILIFLILFMLWKKKKLFYDNFSMSTVYATPTVGGGSRGESSSSDSSSAKESPLYAYQGPSPSAQSAHSHAPLHSVGPGAGAVYAAPSSDQDRRLSVLSSSDVYYSLAKAQLHPTPPTDQHPDLTAHSHSHTPLSSANRRHNDDDGNNITLTQLELPPELLKVEKLPNGNFHLTLPCIRPSAAARPSILVPNETPEPSDPSVSDGGSGGERVNAYAAPRVPPRARRPPNHQPRPSKFNTMVGRVRKKLSETTTAIMDQLGSEAPPTPTARSPLDISGPLSANFPPLPRPIGGSEAELRGCGRAPSPTPTEILFSFDDGEERADDEERSPPPLPSQPPPPPPPPLPDNIYEALPHSPRPSHHPPSSTYC